MKIKTGNIIKANKPFKFTENEEISTKSENLKSYYNNLNTNDENNEYFSSLKFDNQNENINLTKKKDSAPLQECNESKELYGFLENCRQIQYETKVLSSRTKFNISNLFSNPESNRISDITDNSSLNFDIPVDN